MENLCKLAYDTLKKTEVVFTETQLSSASFLSAASDLKFLSSPPGVNVAGHDEDAYSFQHHTMQEFFAAVHVARRSRPSVSKVISQPRSLGGRRRVDHAAGAALRLIDLTHVRVYSRATHDDFFFLLSSIQRSDEDWRLLAFLSSSITSTDKNCSQTKKKAMQALFPPQWQAPRI